MSDEYLLLIHQNSPLVTIDTWNAPAASSWWYSYVVYPYGRR